MSEKITRTKAIRLKCLDCMCGNPHEVRKCPITDCPLYPFRFGSGSISKNARFSHDLEHKD